jgi:hypothetical protein
MRAKHIILTHFSQRYPSVIQVDPTNLSPNPYAIAFDLMEFYCPSQLHDLVSATNKINLVITELEKIKDTEKLQLQNNT